MFVMKIPEVKPKYWTILITLIILSLGLMYYFFVHAQKNEFEFNESCYRDLNRIAINFKQKADVYSQNAGHIVKMAFNKQGGNKEFLKSVNTYINDIKDEKGINQDLTYMYSNKENKANTYDNGYLKFIATDFEDEYTINDTNLVSYNFTFKCPTANFADQLFNNSIFDGYLIGQNGNHVFSSVLPNLDVHFTKTDSSDNRNIVEIGGQEYIAYETKVNSEQNSNNFSIYGLIEKSKFDSAKYRFHSWFLFLITAGLLVILLSIPIFKLISLSPIEELEKKDSIFLFISICLGSSVLLLLLLSLISSVLIGDREVNQNLIKLSDKIVYRFNSEVDSLSKQLNIMDNYLQEYGEKAGNNGVPTYVKNLFLKKTEIPVSYENMKLVFWMDNKGIQKVIYSILPNEGTYSKLSHRNYFKNVVNDKMWVHTGKDNVPDTLFIESIRSVSSGQCLAAISKRSHVRNIHLKDSRNPVDLNVIAITTPLNSVIDAALPSGTEFCIINNDGDVLFHSDKNFNLQENFLVESNNNTKLGSAIYSRTERQFSCRYHNKYIRGYVQPIAGTPLQIITTYDKEISNSFNSQVFSLSFIFVLMILSVLLIQAISLLILNLSKKRKYNSFNLYNWFKYSNSDKAADNYRLLLTGNLTTIVLILLFNMITLKIHVLSRSLGITSSIVASVMIFAMNYYVLSTEKIHIRFIPGFPNLDVRNRLIFLIFSYLCLFVPIGVYIKTGESANALSIFILILIISVQWIVLLKTHKPGKPADGLSWYNLLLLSWLILFTLIPAANSFKIAYDFENEIAVKHKLFDTAINYFKRKESVQGFYTNILGINREIINKQIDNGFYKCDFKSGQLRKCDTSEYRAEDSIFASLNPRYGSAAVVNRNFIFPHAQDSSWKSCYTEDSLSLERKLPDNSSVIYKAAKRQLSFSSITKHNPYFSVIIYITFLFALFILFQYFLLSYMAKKLFGINLIPDRKNVALNFNSLKENKYLFVVGISGSGKNALAPDKYHEVDMKKISQSENWKEEKKKISGKDKTPIVIDKMEFDSYNINTWNKKLELFKELYRTTKKVIILSQIHPEQILKFYEQNIEKEEKKIKNEPSCENKYAEYRAQYMEWQQVLDRYIIYYHPLTKENIDSLLKLKKPGKNEIENDDTIQEQELLYNYYYSIWRTIPLEEKYVLHDFADDGFINSNNKKAISSLGKKGLLVNKGSISMINESFREFILYVLKPEDELNRTREILVRGRWNTFRVVILLVIITLFTLLWFGNQKIITDFKAILVSLAAIATLLVRFGKGN